MSSYHKASSEISSNMEEDEKAAFLVQDHPIPHHTSKASWRQPLLLVALNGVLLFCSVLTLSVTVFLHRAVSENSSESERNALLKQTSHYSPILDALDIPFKEVHIDGGFFETGNDSIYRRLPSPEVDEAWNSISSAGQVFLTTEEVIKLGKDPTMTVRDNEHPDQHIGLINGFHEIHCLNVIRQNLHRDYYFPEGIRSPHHWIHLYHCLNVVLQALQCNLNVDVVTYNWVEEMRGPVFDFSINRKCRDFDALWEWQNRTLKPIESYSFYREGWEPQLPEPEQMKKIKAHQGPREFSKLDPAVVGSIEPWY